MVDRVSFTSRTHIPKVPTNLSGRRLGEPESPGVGERMFDIEIVRIVEDGDNVSSSAIAGLDAVCAVCRERVVGHCDFSHDCEYEIFGFFQKL